MKKVDEFKTVDESGNNYFVNVFQNFINVGDDADPYATLPGLKEFRLADGRALNVVSDTEFTIVATGKHITKI